MTPLVIANLIANAGLPLAQQLITMYHSGNAPVSEADWQALVTLGQYRSSDALAAVGKQIVDGKVVPLKS